jgi:hypothetical protein
VTLGDLLDGEERHVVVRFAFNHLVPGGANVIRARLAWRTPDGAHQACAWQEVAFEAADGAARAAEEADRSVLRFVGAHHAERTRRDAIARSRAGDVQGAQHMLRVVAERIGRYAGSDPDLLQTVAELQGAESELKAHGYQARREKEAYFRSHLASRGQRDLRQSDG